MAIPHNVAVTIPSLVGSSTGLVTDVWHAVDGVRVAATFPQDKAPLLPVGRAGELAFFRPDLAQSATALGKVAYRNEGDTHRSYHFLFGERTRQNLAGLLEPRRAQRVQPDPDEPVEVTLVLEGATSKAVIGAARDVSTTGLGLDIPWEHEGVLANCASVAIRVRIPGQDDVLEFDSRVRNRSLGQGAIIYGLEFELDGVDADDPRLLVLHDFVARRESVEAGQRRSKAA